VLSNISVASSTNSSHGERPNKGEGKRRDPLGIFLGSSAATTADVVKINREGIRAADLTCAGVTDYTTNLPITRLIYRLHD